MSHMALVYLQCVATYPFDRCEFKKSEQDTFFSYQLMCYIHYMYNDGEIKLGSNIWSSLELVLNESRPSKRVRPLFEFHFY